MENSYDTYKQTNKQTNNALLSIKTPTMSSIIKKKKSQYTIDSHNNYFIG